MLTGCRRLEDDRCDAGRSRRDGRCGGLHVISVFMSRRFVLAHRAMSARLSAIRCAQCRHASKHWRLVHLLSVPRYRPRPSGINEPHPDAARC